MTYCKLANSSTSFTFRTDPVSVKWGIELVKDDHITVGGRVTQIKNYLITDIEVVAFAGNGGYAEVFKFYKFLEAHYKQLRTDGVPLRFTNSHEGWDFDVVISKLAGVGIDTKTVNYALSFAMTVQTNNSDFEKFDISKLVGSSGATTQSTTTYTIKAGDTLSSIAQQYNTTVDIIKSVPYNQARIGSNYAIKVGDSILIPQLPPTTTSAVSTFTSQPTEAESPVSSGDAGITMRLNGGW